jgi:hypothetical protein
LAPRAREATIERIQRTERSPCQRREIAAAMRRVEAMHGSPVELSILIDGDEKV